MANLALNAARHSPIGNPWVPGQALVLTRSGLRSSRTGAGVQGVASHAGGPGGRGATGGGCSQADFASAPGAASPSAWATGSSGDLTVKGGLKMKIWKMKGKSIALVPEGVGTGP